MSMGQGVRAGAGLEVRRAVRASFLAVGVAVVLGLSALVSGASERVVRLRERSEEGATTAEYAIVTLAAVGFAGLLLAILKGGEVKEMLMSIVREALSR